MRVTVPMVSGGGVPPTAYSPEYKDRLGYERLRPLSVRAIFLGRTRIPGT